MDMNKKYAYKAEPWYGTYHNMFNRCYCNKHKEFPIYGGRGVSVCNDWKDIKNFKAWIQDSGFEPGLTIDRIDPNGNYEPSNCRWATRKEQANNRRNTRYITYKWLVGTISEWAE